MSFFLCRLLPPRPDFPFTMSATEAAAMQRHVGYWRDLAERGVVLLFGPVADPAGAWGVGVVEVADEAELHAITSADPAITADIGLRYETAPMPQVVLGRPRR